MSELKQFVVIFKYPVKAYWLGIVEGYGCVRYTKLFNDAEEAYNAIAGRGGLYSGKTWVPLHNVVAVAEPSYWESISD